MTTAAGIYAEFYPLAAHARHIDHLYVLRDRGQLASEGTHVFASPFFEVQVAYPAGRDGSMRVRMLEPRPDAQPRLKPFHGLIAGIRLSRRLSGFNADARWHEQMESTITAVADANAPLDPLIAHLDNLAARIVAALNGFAVDASTPDLVRTSAAVPTVEAAAQRLGVSARTVRRHVRSQMGISPKALQRLTRFRQALHHLAANDTPLANLAHEAGYADQAHLTLAFRKHAGVPPARLRTVARRRSDNGGAVRFFKDAGLAARVSFLQVEPAET
jgi:AraC-like DNA-binding protein